MSRFARGVRHKLRILLGRVHFDRLEELIEKRCSVLRASQDRLVAGMEEQERVVSQLQDELREQTRCAGAAETSFEQIIASLTRIDTERQDMQGFLESVRGAEEHAVEVLSRLDNRVLRYCEICDRIDGNLLKTQEEIADLAVKLGSLHGSWEAGMKESLSKFEEVFQTLAQREYEAREIADLQGRTSNAEERADDLADQAAHLIDMLGQSRKELGEQREQANLYHEERAGRLEAESELADAREETQALEGELERVREAVRTFRRWKETLDAELERVRGERDRLLIQEVGGEGDREAGTAPAAEDL